MKIVLLVILLVINLSAANAGTDTLTVHKNDVKLLERQFFQQIEDPGKQLTIQNILSGKQFTNANSVLPSLKISNPVIWLKMILQNKTNQANIPITIANTIVDKFDLFLVDKNKVITHLKPETPASGTNNFGATEIIIKCPLAPNSCRLVYMRIQSVSPGVIPVEIYAEDTHRETYNSKNIGFGIFIGVVLIMMFYNLVLFLIVKDRSYLFYVSYVGFLSVSQGLLHGYKLFDVDIRLLNDYITPVIRVFLWLSIILFVNEFLQLRKQYPEVYKYYKFLFHFTVLPLIFVITKQSNIAYTIISFNSTASSIFLMIVGVWLYSSGLKHAKFFMLAWGVFLFSVLISVARNKDLLPYNSFTSNILLFGVAFELVLFAIALADKINFFRDQNNESQFFALKLAKENEKLITGQNILLENKVLERTKELLESNKNLTGLITNLKAAQSQLIETEKMASLGQLTAGIAHEINNPINFVKSNVKPLKMDFKDIFDLLDEYATLEDNVAAKTLLKPAIDFKHKMDLDFVKKEVTDLLNGIEEGASRTAEIVQSLREFSRTDEVELRPADINKSILNSLVLLRNLIPYYIEITPVFDKLETINCYPGKLNQVFINLIHNSIQAIIEKKKHSKESILIATKDYPENITIEITDTGIGMTDEVRQKMFDPFFTTKDVGEGTGLGLSIVFGIIEKHKGAIDVKSKRGKGTTIIIMLPKTLV